MHPDERDMWRDDEEDRREWERGLWCPRCGDRRLQRNGQWVCLVCESRERRETHNPDGTAKPCVVPIADGSLLDRMVRRGRQ